MTDKTIISSSILEAIGSAIIAKGGSSVPILPRDMPAAIRSISTASTPEITGKSFDLSTETGVTNALAVVLETFGGTVTGGKGANMKKSSPLTITKDGSTYKADIYDDSTGIGLDITKSEASPSA